MYSSEFTSIVTLGEMEIERVVLFWLLPIILLFLTDFAIAVLCGQGSGDGDTSYIVSIGNGLLYIASKANANS